MHLENNTGISPSIQPVEDEYPWVLSPGDSGHLVMLCAELKTYLDSSELAPSVDAQLRQFGKLCSGAVADRMNAIASLELLEEMYEHIFTKLLEMCDSETSPKRRKEIRQWVDDHCKE